MGIKLSGGGKPRVVASAVGHQRLAAAMSHYRRLEQQWQAWMRAHPIATTTKVSPLTREADIVMRIDTPVDAALASPAKACLGEVRAALDNMVVALVRDAGGDEKQCSSASFPITDKEEHWPAAAKSRLPAVSDEVRDRIAQAQPWASTWLVNAEHPLMFLKQVWEGDKHHAPMTLEWGTDFVNGESLLSQATLTMSPEAADRWERSMTPDEVDRSLDVTVGVVRDGDVLVRMHLPDGVQDVQIESADRSFALMAVGDGENPPGPLFPQLMNLMRFAGQVVDYVTGASDEVPPPWAPGEGIGLGE